MFKYGLISILIGCFLLSCPALAEIQQTERYEILNQPVRSAPHVAHFFSFYCGPCYFFSDKYPVNKKINELLSSEQKMAKYHVSAMGKLGPELTEAWAIATVTGKTEAIEKWIFEAIQVNHNLNSIEDIKKGFALQGISSAEYDSARNSLMVRANIMQQDNMVKQFGVRGTPAYYVMGMYHINNAGMRAHRPDEYATEFAAVIKKLIDENPA